LGVALIIGGASTQDVKPRRGIPVKGPLHPGRGLVDPRP
jgi:hypothetical protein